MKITYNAPVTLTFSLIALAVFLINQYLFSNLNAAIFTAPGKIGSDFAFDWKNVLDYFRLFTHVLGHVDWSHVIGNLSFILLLGPLLEERYGSGMLLLMIIVTAFVTGILNACFISSGLLGASGVVFMMILLSSFTTITKNQIPLTFIFIVVLYMGQEILKCFQQDNISSIAHIAGGLCGSLFGFLTAQSPRKTKSAKIDSDKTIVNKQTPENTYNKKDTKQKTYESNDSNDETVVISSVKF
ncbi:MAG: rhomboid family intramembrane serine protease [Spirochaetaceae bacterium]|nr:rhomboid family intramembrane serine protease [Spirochaetaceae bacterium]